MKEPWEQEFDNKILELDSKGGWNIPYEGVNEYKIKNFIKGLLVSQRETLAVEIEGMKCDERKVYDFGAWSAHSYEEKMLVNAVLTDAAAHIRNSK